MVATAIAALCSTMTTIAAKPTAGGTTRSPGVTARPRRGTESSLGATTAQTAAPRTMPGAAARSTSRTASTRRRLRPTPNTSSKRKRLLRAVVATDVLETHNKESGTTTKPRAAKAIGGRSGSSGEATSMVKRPSRRPKPTASTADRSRVVPAGTRRYARSSDGLRTPSASMTSTQAKRAPRSSWRSMSSASPGDTAQQPGSGIVLMPGGRGAASTIGSSQISEYWLPRHELPSVFTRTFVSSPASATEMARADTRWFSRPINKMTATEPRITRTATKPVAARAAPRTRWPRS